MNAEQLQKQWQEVYDLVLSYNSDNQSQASAFLSLLQPQAMSDGFLMLTAETEFIRDWVERHYSDVIKQALADIYQMPYNVVFEVNPNQQIPQVTTAQVKPEPSVQQSTMEQLNTAVQPSTPAQNAAASTPLNPEEVKDSYAIPTSSLTFENFVVGASNHIPYSMALAVAENPGREMLNPLFIYGRSGLGKTHLMRAIQNHAMEAHPNLKAIYVDSADLLNQYVEATISHDKEKTSFKNFKNNYQEADILLIDDIQYLADKKQTLDIIFQIFNYMVDQGKQVVLSADRAPKNIDIDERYQSRFSSGGIYDIQPPEVETKLAIIKSLVDEYCTTNGSDSFTLPEDIMLHIAEISGPNIRELKGAVTKTIYTKNTLGDGELTKEQVSELLQNQFSGGVMKKLTIFDIQKEVEKYYDVTHSDLIGQKRVRKIAYARQIAIYLAREMLDLPYTYIADSFGGRDHSTIMYSFSTVEEKIKTNRDMAEEIENIKRRIREA